MKLTKLALFALVAFWAVLVGLPELAHAAAPPPGPSVGKVLTNLHVSISRVPNILTTIAFIGGIVLAVTGVLKLKNHVDNPNQVPLSDGIKRLIAGGAFLGLPVTTNVIKGSLFGNDGGELGSGTGFGVKAAKALPVALDNVAVTFITNMATPMKYLLISFTFITGLAMILVGISRLIKTAQEGPRGPAGMGTFFTFACGMALMAIGQSMGTFNVSIFGDGTMKNYAVFSATAKAALGKSEQQMRNVIGSVLIFVSLVGFIAFMRGLFILKLVADGNQNHSITQALTFLIGGALAVNLGAVINAVQSTIGYNAIGFTFT
ncbi:MAG: hypothetical protein HND56_01625 [Pseudomonadota bacterium]|jgi:hypothetical protein|nr:hypothetical protein [Pseudomonadota bacterium]QKK04462.1 MAG: hypothetical protein HND56_01625 [Pseudomonadota bacterium]